MQHSLVMTPIEAKGLEFDDVFVVNFFEDSPANCNWNALLEYTREHTQRSQKQTERVAKTTFEQMEVSLMADSAIPFTFLSFVFSLALFLLCVIPGCTCRVAAMSASARRETRSSARS
jgi:hypothetical protein